MRTAPTALCTDSNASCVGESGAGQCRSFENNSRIRMHLEPSVVLVKLQEP
jgi:hypothetical protein